MSPQKNTKEMRIDFWIYLLRYFSVTEVQYIGKKATHGKLERRSGSTVSRQIYDDRS